MGEKKKVIYISAPTADGFREELARYVDAVNDLGCIALTTSRLPEGLTKWQEQQIRCGMIDAADAALFLSDFAHFGCPTIDYEYAAVSHTPIITPPTGSDVKPYWLREALEEVSA